ncbi:MAG: DUF2236 domain-containing protein [Leptospirales bacterium]|nr:DUF2236 domain-containing protein [Leptospirales bacterium]
MPDSAFRDTAEWHSARAVGKRLALHLQQTDELADAVVHDFTSMRPGAGMILLSRILAQGRDAVPDAPQSLVDLLASMETEPLWLDWDEIDLGASAFMRAGAFGAAALLCHSLPIGYLDPLSSKPLIFSGRLVERAPRRLMETARFVYECCQPGGMRRSGRGFHICVRVRLMHAQVRRLLLKSGRWNAGLWGQPISEFHLLGTNVFFSLAVVDALRRWGIYISSREEQAIFSLWRYNGFLMGISSEVLPANLSEARRILNSLELSRERANEKSVELMQALLDAGAELSEKILHVNIQNLVRAALGGLVRNLLGETRADELGLPRNIFRFLPLLWWPVLRSIEFLRLCIPGSRRLAVYIGTYLWQWSVNAGLQGRDASFAIPQRMHGERLPGGNSNAR